MSTPSGAPRPSLTIVSAAVFDVVAVLVFVVIGRVDHDDGLTVGGIFSTFWPFAVGGLVGWAVSYVIAHVHTSAIGHPNFRPQRLLPDGVIIWPCTVAIGMVLRAEFGQGIAVSFIVVASVVLGVFLLGWRSVRRRLRGRNRKSVASGIADS